MKPKRAFEPHLVLKEVALHPAEELNLRFSGWHLLRIISGEVHWQNVRSGYDLSQGSVLMCSDRAMGVLRASQRGIARFHCFRVQPDRLMGLIGLPEQRFLQAAATQERFAVRVFDQTTRISQTFEAVCNLGERTCFRLRFRLLELFVEAFGQELHVAGPKIEPVPDAVVRLCRLLEETSASELMELSFSDLVRAMRCTPRHVCRIFQKVTGMSFRQKRAQVRLVRAQELLATTKSKVVEVALESGFQSPCLFNLMFKRRFGVTPAKWREQTKHLSRLGSRPALP